MQRRLIGKRGSCLAVVAVLLFAGLLMAACSLDGIDNGEGQGTLPASVGENPKNVPPVVNNPPKGQPVTDNPSEEAVIEEPPVAENPPEEAVIEEPPVAGNPSETDNPPTEPPVTNNPSEVDDPPTEPPVTDNPSTEPPVTNNPSETDNPSEESPVIDNPPETGNPPTEPPVIDNPSIPSMPLPPIEALGSYPGLNAEIERLVKQAWVNFCGGENEWFSWRTVRFNVYYGNYDGCVVIAIDHPTWGLCMAGGIIIGDKLFGFPEALVYLLAWKDGRLYDARQAYKLGFLTDDDVNDMYERHPFHYLSPELYIQNFEFPAYGNEKVVQFMKDFSSGAIAWPVDPQVLEELNISVRDMSYWSDYDEQSWPENGWGPGEIRRLW